MRDRSGRLHARGPDPVGKLERRPHVRDAEAATGEDVAALEHEVARDHGIAHAVAVSSGTDALLAALVTHPARCPTPRRPPPRCWPLPVHADQSVEQIAFAADAIRAFY